MIRVYDAADNVIETHEHGGEFKEPRPDVSGLVLVNPIHKVRLTLSTGRTVPTGGKTQNRYSRQAVAPRTSSERPVKLADLFSVIPANLQHSLKSNDGVTFPLLRSETPQSQFSLYPIKIYENSSLV